MAGSAQESRVRDLVDALARRGIELPGGRITIDEFGDSAELSGALLQLIRSGAKRAGASLLWSYDHDGEQVAAAGDVAIVLDYGRRPCMLTRVTRVEIVPFDRVTTEFAALEGEGDLSLAFWWRVHWDFFSRECARIGRTPETTMPVVCAAFELLRVFDP